MRRPFWIGSFLLTLNAWAVDHTVVVVDRVDPSGKSVHVLRLDHNASRVLYSKLGASTAPPGAEFAFVPGTTGIDGQGHLFQSVATPVSRRASTSYVVPGKLMQSVRQWPDFAPRGLSAFAPDEAVGWDEVQEALVVLSPSSYEYVSQDRVLGTTGPLHDVTVLRSDYTAVLVVAHVGPSLPSPQLPADYRVFRLNLEPNGRASLVATFPLPRRLPGTPLTLGSDGLFYVSADRRGDFVAFQPFGNASPWTAALGSLRAARGTPIAPLDMVPTPSGEALYARLGDDLVLVMLSLGGVMPFMPGIFSAGMLEAVSRHSHARGTATTAIRTVQPPFRKYHLTRYANLFKTSVTPPPNVTEVAKQRNVRVLILKKLVELLGPLPADRLSASLVVSALNRRPNESDWLVQLLNELTPEQQKLFHLEKRGFYFLEPAPTDTIDVRAWLDTLAGIGRCSAILAAH